MIAISDSHLKAIARSIHFMRSGVTSQMEPKHREAIMRDISRLDEVHKFCRQQIIEPGLPMSKIPVAILAIGAQVGPDNSKASR